MKKNRLYIPIFLVFALIASHFLTNGTVGNDSGTVEQASSSYYSGEDYALAVHFIDVGQADCELIALPDGKYMLIDAGNNSDGDDVVSYLKSVGVQKIDYLVGTHPHADHIGGLDDVIEAFDIGTIYMPKVTTDTKTYEDVLDAIDAKNLTVTTARTGVRIYSDALTAIDFVAPVGSDYESLNNYSAVVLLKYKDASFLFTGDAEEESESEITADVSADVLKVGHHGSSTSSSASFLKKVSPKYAVISCGEGNDYGHPHQETLEALSSLGVTLFRTDLNGTVICRTDGENYYWECEKQ